MNMDHDISFQCFVGFMFYDLVNNEIWNRGMSNFLDLDTGIQDYRPIEIGIFEAWEIPLTQPQFPMENVSIISSK